MIASVFYAACCLLAARVSAAPATATTPVAINEINSQASLLHTADHEVTRLGVLLGESESIKDKSVFFIESDVDEQGERVDYGLYALTKDPKSSHYTVVTKLLDNAYDITVVSIKEAAYFAAKDGIYVYNKEKNTADKYGSVNDEVISIAVENATGVLYYVNKQHQLYKVTEGGQKSTIVDEVKNAEQITVDFKGHLYYYTVDKKLYVYNGQNIREVEGIPTNVNKVWLVKTPVLVEDYGFVNVDDQYYMICGATATARTMSRSRGSLVTSALSMDMGLVVFYATDKKIYEFNVIEKIVEGVMDALSKGLKKMLQDMRDSLNSVYA